MIWFSADERMPKDGTVIMRWHKIHKVPIAVRWMPDVIAGGRNWIERTGLMTWPEEAFTLFWGEVPEGPVDGQ